MRTKLRKQWLIVTIAALSVLAILMILRLLFPGRPFDPVAWHDESQVREDVRLAMADRLIADGALIGKTRAEVVALLGEPPPTGYFFDWDLVYWLGQERGFIGIDSEWLVLRLGEDGLVVDNRIVRD